MVSDVLTVLSFVVLCIIKILPVISQVGRCALLKFFYCYFFNIVVMILLCLDFLTMLEGDADIVCALDSSVVHYRMSVFDYELGENVWQYHKGLEECCN